MRKLKKIRKIIIFFLITTVVFVFAACTSENTEPTTAPKTNLNLEAKESSDLEKETGEEKSNSIQNTNNETMTIEEMKKSLLENGIDLEANHINPEEFSAYISANFEDPEDYIAYIEDARNTNAWDLESEFACFAIWNDVKYLNDSINRIGVNLDDYDVDPYTLLGYIGEYCNGSVDTFIEYINENYPNDFASFTDLVD